MSDEKDRPTPRVSTIDTRADYRISTQPAKDAEGFTHARVIHKASGTEILCGMYPAASVLSVITTAISQHARMHIHPRLYSADPSHIFPQHNTVN